MFSLKMKWVRFADSIQDLEKILGQRTIAPIKVKGGNRLLVYHNNQYYLVSSICPHQGAKLDRAACEDGKIVCPWHHFGFDLETGRGGGLYLENYPVDIREDGVYAGFEYFSWFG